MKNIYNSFFEKQVQNKDFNNKMSIISIIDIELLEDEENYEDSDESSTEEDNYESVLEIITNLSNSLKVRLDALEDYYKKESDNMICKVFFFVATIKEF